MANYCRQRHIHPHIHGTDRLQWRGVGGRGRGLSRVVVSCHDAENVFSGPERYFRGGEEVIRSASPFRPPPSKATSQHSPKISTDPSMSGALVIKYIDGATKHHVWEEEERCAATQICLNLALSIIDAFNPAGKLIISNLYCSRRNNNTYFCLNGVKSLSCQHANICW